jgi:hypothetical protein
MFTIVRTDLETGEQIEFQTVYPTREEAEFATRIINRESCGEFGSKTEHAIFSQGGHLVARYQKGECILRILPVNAQGEFR